MDIQNIRAFLMVAEMRSFSRAADKLFITQPAISKRISTLEFALDCQLFDRLGKNVQLTQAGEALIPSYQRIISELDETQRIVSNLRSSVSGHLKFGTSHHIGLHRLPPVLRQYTRKYPEVELDIQFMDSEQASAMILKGSIELALITLPDAIEKPLTTIPVWSDPMECVVAKDHILAAQDHITRQQLRHHGVLIQSHSTHTRNIIDSALKLDDNTNIIMESNYLETIKAMIQNGLGWGVLPRSMIDDSLHQLKIKGASMNRHLGVLLHESRTLSSPANALLETLNSHDKKNKR
ncbi:MAG: LysR family transcriptional regulator [Gammaproteobacteria bacterium]|nr:LysR family transcriptional regulator [Gammaproteobacteria bacterium]NNJ48923.1 LysR family transcriptional regulator [Gammaproteobacteria bacterium]